MEKKLLIVDDEQDMVAMLKRYFELGGYYVMVAENGLQAIEKAGKQPDLILLDINMPDIDGIEVCSRIRDFVSCPILFLTARIEDKDKLKGFAVGGDDYIVKQQIPFQNREFEIIELLSSYPGQLFSKDRIYERIWDIDSEADMGVIMEHVSKIRAKFAEAGCKPYIQTVWGCGYKWTK